MEHARSPRCVPPRPTSTRSPRGTPDSSRRDVPERRRARDPARDAHLRRPLARDRGPPRRGRVRAPERAALRGEVDLAFVVDSVEAADRSGRRADRPLCPSRARRLQARPDASEVGVKDMVRLPLIAYRFIEGGEAHLRRKAEPTVVFRSDDSGIVQASSVPESATRSSATDRGSKRLGRGRPRRAWHSASRDRARVAR